VSELFAARLKELRGNRSKAEFARDLGIPAPMYHRYETGQVPKSDNLRVIATKCDTTVDWLLGGVAEGVQPRSGPGSRSKRDPPPTDDGARGLRDLEWQNRIRPYEAKVAELEARVASLERALVKLVGSSSPDVKS